VNAKTAKGNTSLMGASENGHAEVVKLLIEKGADVNEKNTFGNSALWGACLHGHEEVVKLLLEKDAGVIEADYVAAKTIEIIRLLEKSIVKKGYNITLPNSNPE